MPKDIETAVATIGEEILAKGVQNCGPAANAEAL
jgi:hypothetical protein